MNDWIGKLDGRLTLAECRTAGLASSAIVQLSEQVKKIYEEKAIKSFPGLRVRFVLERPDKTLYDLPDEMWLEEARCHSNFKIIIDDSDGGVKQSTKPKELV